MHVLLADVVHHDRPRTCVDVIDDVVQCNGQGVYILAVERRDERFVELFRDLVRDGRSRARLLYPFFVRARSRLGRASISSSSFAASSIFPAI